MTSLGESKSQKKSELKKKMKKKLKQTKMGKEKEKNQDENKDENEKISSTENVAMLKEEAEVIESHDDEIGSKDGPESSHAIIEKESSQSKTEVESEPAEKKSSEDSNSNSIISETTFESLNVCQILCDAAKNLNWTHASVIQKETLPAALAGRDIIGLAETGSGKTGAFAIPMLQSLLQNPQRGAVYGIILAPTRELAFQIHEVISALGSSMGASCVCIVGGVDHASQAIALARNPHIVTATPGRLVDHLTNTKGFHLRKVKYLIMDEADRMLSMDFEKELDQILEVMPGHEKRTTMLFSATMTSKVQKLERASLSDPVRIQVSTKFQTPQNLLQSYLFIPAKYKDVYLTYIINENAGKSILVFGATCNNVQRLAIMLRNLGFPAISLHGQMSQPKRLGALHKFKCGTNQNSNSKTSSKGCDIMICTDVASRGLDIPNVDVVINFDLPGHGKDYIHRVGRTARAGKSGTAIAMVTQYDVEVYQRLETLLNRKLPEHKLDEQTVLVLYERVSEAQRMATRELKEQLASGGRNNGRKRRPLSHDEDIDRDVQTSDGNIQQIVEQQLRRGYAGGSSGKGGGYHNQRGGGHQKQKRHKQRY
mmetsp:Transcript_15849/g.22571  ORF Transcript_15849/g.22571 Transcript_15849/m.22571 type:complete len:598 (+) Transcript_15849:172-1965(+)